MEYVVGLCAVSSVCAGVSTTFGLDEGSLATLPSLVALPSAVAADVDAVPGIASFPAAAGVAGCAVAGAVLEVVELVGSSGSVFAAVADVWLLLPVGDVAEALSAELWLLSAVLLDVGLSAGAFSAFVAAVFVVVVVLPRVLLDALSCTAAELELAFSSIVLWVAVPSTPVATPSLTDDVA
ncbi:hypothetical protein ADJ70_10350 [Olsenella sp. oral taxon 807]|uniref:hypothetical protein n=1 Tax=Olsenella sp. oral taxon 807 TaxID=712411 RepID=UPI000679F62B|nr:hypothetical protein [Olsenella sp. oral taxon 807]AKT49243.1 hypothetical protein ADJ70_10350 [Olsenella sp. oral taxon 807]